MPIQCHTLNKAASKQFSFELAPKRDCFGASRCCDTHFYIYVCMLLHTHTHTNICTYIDTYVCTWERRRIEMKAKVAFDPQPKVEQKSIISEESKKFKLTQQNSREKFVWNWEYIFLVMYVCVCECQLQHSNAFVWNELQFGCNLQEATDGQRTFKTTLKGQEWSKYTNENTYAYADVSMYICLHVYVLCTHII